MKIEPGAVSASEIPSMRSVDGRTKTEQDIAQKKTRELKGAEPEEDRVAPEEILDRIKEISQDGLYSIRFEKSEEINELIVKVVDRNTEEVIRQIPPEAILGIKANLKEFLGNIVNKYS